MRLVFTKQASESLEEALAFVAPKVSSKTLESIRNSIIERTEKLIEHPFTGRSEEYLEHLGLNHRRVIISHYKIIYRVSGHMIYITDIFDSRQDPKKMKG